MSIEIRLNDADSLDEVVGEGETVHLEQMDKDHWYLGVGDVQIWLTSKEKITVHYEDNRISEGKINDQ